MGFVVVVSLLSHIQLFCASMDCSPPGSSVNEILRARILEWVAIPFSGGSSLPGDRTRVSCIGRMGLSVLEMASKEIEENNSIGD